MTLLERFGNLIRSLDQFGVVFKPSITQEAEYKTVLGGILSILLYGVSFGYFIYEIVVWQSGGMLPKITVSSDVITDQVIYFDEVVLSVQMRKYPGNMIDPFNPENLVLLPLLLSVINGVTTSTPIIPNIEKSQNEQFVIVNFQNFTLAVSSNRTDDHPEVELTIVITDCVPMLLPEGMKCANSSTRKQFFSQSLNALYFTTFINQFNTQTESIRSFASVITLALDPTTSYYATNTLKLQETTVDIGFLFENAYQTDFVLDVSTTAQQVNGKFFANVLNTTAYFINNYQLNGIKSIQYVQYPKVNEVLADIGSIVSLLLLTSALVIMINQYFLENEAVQQVIHMFYPKLKNIKSKKNWYGKVVKIELDGKQMNLLKFNDHYSKLIEIARSKLTVTNQIYEISRLQFILQSLLPRNHLIYSHQIGIKESNLIEIVKEEEESSIDNLNQIQEYLSIKQTKIVLYFVISLSYHKIMLYNLTRQRNRIV